jgi:murein DD-endopeptidase MepM/ murein hydrolase activator NlpD
LLIAHLLPFFFLCVTANAQTFRYAIIPENPRPGEPVTVAVSGAEVKTAALVSGGRRIAKASFFTVPADGVEPGFLAAVLTVPSTARAGKVAIVLEGSPSLEGASAGNGPANELSLNIAEREFVSEVIELNAALTGLRTEPDPQKTAESDRLWAILNRTGSDAYWFGKFILPVNTTRRTSAFGDRRVYKYSSGATDTSIHAGIDFGVPTGTAIIACGPGKVVLARNRIVTGNSVVIEHLPGVYSLYYHLDTITAVEGALVSTGQLIGRSGATGLATGPHLHWEIRVSGENTDPDAFIARPILDKKAILSKMAGRE